MFDVTAVARQSWRFEYCSVVQQIVSLRLSINHCLYTSCECDA